MKMKRRLISSLVFLIVLLTFAGYSSSSEGESVGEYIDDTVITTKVKSLLAKDDFLKSFQISVETYKGTVQLSGFVDSQQAVNRAVEITTAVKGVTDVKNDLVVK